MVLVYGIGSSVTRGHPSHTNGKYNNKPLVLEEEEKVDVRAEWVEWPSNGRRGFNQRAHYSGRWGPLTEGKGRPLPQSSPPLDPALDWWTLCSRLHSQPRRAPKPPHPGPVSHNMPSSGHCNLGPWRGCLRSFSSQSHRQTENENPAHVARGRREGKACFAWEIVSWVGIVQRCWIGSHICKGVDNFIIIN